MASTKIDATDEFIATRPRALRQIRGQLVRGIAAGIGVSHSLWSRWETGVIEPGSANIWIVDACGGVPVLTRVVQGGSVVV